jgi:hypothetical protein
VCPGGHQQGASAVLGTVVFDALLCPEPEEIRWSSLGNWTVWFSGYYELVLAFVLVATLSPWTLFFSAATSSGLFYMSYLASSLTEVSLLGPIWPWLPPNPSAKDPSLGTHCMCCCPGASAIFSETGPSNFPVSGPFYPAGGQCSRNGHLLCSSICGQNS